MISKKLKEIFFLENNINSEKIFDFIGRISLVIITIFLLLIAFLDPLQYAEIDSNALPVISLQYRGSIFINDSDIRKAREDFPNLYQGINSYDDLRSAKLVKITEDKWQPFYFPIYPLLCIPSKIILNFFGLSQERCFSITNAILICSALWFIQRRLNTSYLQRLIVIILLILSPVIYYINYINYEVFIFAMVIISLTKYLNKNYKSSAFFLSLSGQSNITVMAIGIVMVGTYLLQLLIRNKEKKICKIIKENYKETIKYAFCFMPCLIPMILMSYDVSISGITTDYLWDRFLMYFFDPTLGFFTFAPLQLIIFFILAIRSLTHGQKKSVVWLLFLIGTVFSFSLFLHINCGVIFCARYLIWTYPIIPIFLSTIGYDTIHSTLCKKIIYYLIILSTLFLLYINSSTAFMAYHFNNITQWILQYIPGVYNPYSATFYCRTLHIDGGYYCTDPAYYKDATGNIRKLIFKADEGEANVILEDLIGNEKSIQYLKYRLNEIKPDGKFHYINFSKLDDLEIREKTLEEKGILKKKDIILEKYDFNLTDVGDYQEGVFPIRIMPNTYYKIELELDENFDFSTPVYFFVDFYGGSEYQEASDFLSRGVMKYEFYFNSGDFEAESLDIYARIINFTHMDTDEAPIRRFTITEMLYVDKESTY